MRKLSVFIIGKWQGTFWSPESKLYIPSTGYSLTVCQLNQNTTKWITCSVNAILYQIVLNKTILCKLWGIVDVNLSFVILWVNLWVKKYIWQRITFDIKTQMNLVHLSFLGRLGRSGSSEKFCSFAKVSYCWGRFVHIFMGKTNAKLNFLYVVVSALKNWLI